MPEAVSPSVVALPSLRSAVLNQNRGNVPSHSHEAMELVWVLRGATAVETREGRLEGGPGALYIFPAGCAHDHQCRAGWRTLCVLFSNTGGMLEEKPRVLKCAREPRIRRWMEELVTLHRSRVPAFVSDCLLLALLSEINYFEHHLKNMAALPPTLAKAVRLLQQSAGAAVDGPMLARAAGVSGSRLGALFRRHFGVSPLQYHRQLRMELAKKLLLNPYASIDEIARQAGFEDANYFCRLFRKTCGVAPGQWRKQA